MSDKITVGIDPGGLVYGAMNVRRKTCSVAFGEGIPQHLIDVCWR